MASSRYRELLRQRRFLALSSAMLVDNSASWAFNTVFAVVVFQRTGSFSLISIAIAARWVPSLVVGPFAGLLGDRYERVHVLVSSAAAGAVGMATLAVLVGARAPVGWLIAVSALQALAGTPYEPAVAGIVPDLVPERLLAAANGYLEVLRNAAVLVGPVLGAVFLVTDEPALAVLVNAASYVVPLIVALRLGMRSGGAADAVTSEGVVAELRAGVMALVRQRSAFVLVLACAVDSAIMGVITVSAVPISIKVGTGADRYSYLLVACSLGSVLAAGAATKLAGRRTLAAVIALSLVLQGMPVLIILADPRPWVAFVALFVSGAAMLVVDILAVTALQRDLPREYVSRIFGIFDTLLLAVLVAVTAVAGLITQRFGIDTVLWLLGVGTPVLVLVALPALVHTDRRTAAAAAALAPILELLHRLDLFDGADRAALERIAGSAVRVELPAGHIVLQEGTSADDVWLLADGRLAVSALRVGDLPDVVAPNYVGEIGVLHRRARTATVTTVGPCILFRIAGDDFVEGVTDYTASSSLMTISGVRIARTPTLTS